MGVIQVSVTIPSQRSALIKFLKLAKKGELSVSEAKVVLRHATDTPVDILMYLANPTEAGGGPSTPIDTGRLRPCDS